MKIQLTVILWLGLCVEVFAHGRSPEMIRELNAPVPDWMSLAESIKVDLIEGQTLPQSHLFRPRSGGATNSRNRVQIPERGLEFQVDYRINYTGNNAAGHGVSLSPDGTKLIVNSGLTSHLYEIALNGEHWEVPIRLPHVTYDEGKKGFIWNWSWASNSVLIGRAEITDETGNEIIEGRLYVFHLKEQALARLDLGGVDLPDTADIEVVSIGEDLEHLRARLGDRELVMKADLKSPPELIAKSYSVPTSRTQEIERPLAPRTPIDSKPAPLLPNEQSDVPTRLPVAAVMIVIVGVLGVLWLLLKNRK